MANVVRTVGGQIIDLGKVRSSASGPEFAPGTTQHGVDGAYYLYAKAASGPFVRGHVLMLDSAGTGSLAFGFIDPAAANLLNRPVAVHQATSTANSGDFSWFQRGGVCVVRAHAGTVSQALQPGFIGGSAGVVTGATASVSATYITGFSFLSSGSASLPAYLHWPAIQKYFGSDNTT